MIDPITQYLLEQDEDHHAWYEKEGGKVEKEIYNWLIHEFLELNRKATASCEQAGYSGSKLRKCYIKSSSKVYSKWSSWANTVGKNKCKGMSKNNAKIMSMCMNGMKKAKVRAKAISKQYK